MSFRCPSLRFFFIQLRTTNDICTHEENEREVVQVMCQASPAGDLVQTV